MRQSLRKDRLRESRCSLFEEIVLADEDFVQKQYRCTYNRRPPKRIGVGFGAQEQLHVLLELTQHIEAEHMAEGAPGRLQHDAHAHSSEI